MVSKDDEANALSNGNHRFFSEALEKATSCIRAEGNAENVELTEKLANLDPMR
jgi:hypothetical protein